MSNKDPQTKNIISTASVTLCKNVSSVTAHGGYAGGIAGRINSKNGSVISNCYNRGISIRGNITTYDGQFTPGSIASVLIAPPAWDDPGKHTATFKIWGEIDGNGKINMRDYSALQKLLLKSTR
ncbi:MAG: hypothetical protein IKN17_12370 [Ruminococcus sp.]|nr:hypothetical protein [Ruminococcus sp.]